MANLIAQSPLRDQDPVTIGQVTLTELVIDLATSVSAFQGQGKAVSDALKSALGVALPAPGKTTSKGDVRAIWTGPNRALVIGTPVPPIAGAAVVLQGDGLVAVLVEGPGAEAVLARLIPLDLRETAFKKGQTARTQVNHMTASVTRTAAQGFEILVMRSMARTLWHELTEAALGVAAR